MRLRVSVLVAGKALPDSCCAARLEGPDMELGESLRLHRHLYQALKRQGEQTAAEKELIELSLRLAPKVEQDSLGPTADLIRREAPALLGSKGQWRSDEIYERHAKMALAFL